MPRLDLAGARLLLLALTAPPGAQEPTAPGAARENWCDHDGAKLAVQAHCSPYACESMPQSFVTRGTVWTVDNPAAKAITDPIALPYSND